jgi:hypothetical protein
MRRLEKLAAYASWGYWRAREWFLQRYVRPVILRLSVRHVHGPKRVGYGPQEVVAISVVRNGELHIRSFLNHHFALGVKHVVLLLNDSTDQTEAIAREYDNVTLLRTDRPYASYENLMKTYLARRFSTNRWNLCVDVDELFDYPSSDRLPLTDLIGYLNEHGYDVVVAQLLDLFADVPLQQVTSRRNDDLRAQYTFFDVSNVRKTEYEFGRLSNPDVKMHWGGIRMTVFGTNNGLTKAALVKINPKLELFVYYHHVRGGAVADFTAVLLHYPFVSTFMEKVADAVATGRYGPVTTKEYEGYSSGASRSGGELMLRLPTATRLENVAQLLDDGFLVSSPSFEQCRGRDTPDVAE